MSTKKKTSYFLIAFASFFLVSFAVVAQESTTSTVLPTTVRPTKTPAEKAARCAKATKRIDAKIKRFDTNTDHPRLTKIAEKVAKLITDFEAKGVNVAQLEADLATFTAAGGPRETCKNAYGLFIAKLKATKSSVCGQSEGQFKAALDAAKLEKAKVKTACDAARAYIRNVIKKDLQALRKQRASSPNTTVTPTGASAPAGEVVK